MHWLTVTLIVFLVVVLIVMVCLFAIALTRKPSEPDLIAGDGILSIPEFLQFDRQNLSPEELTRELRRVITQPIQEVAPRSADNALRMLNHIQSNTGEPTISLGEGDGIVICADGAPYALCAFVLVSELRRINCSLPVEIWHRTNQLHENMIALFADLQCEVRNIDAAASINIPNEYAVKPLAVLYSKFKRVLLLDADNVTCKDPTYLFELLDEHPAVFWMNHWRLNTKSSCYTLFSREQMAKLNFENCQDGGQVLLDKSKCLLPLHVCTKIALHMRSQLHRIFPETASKDSNIWHFSWIIKNTAFKMIPFRPAGVGVRTDDGKYLGNTMAQFDHSEDIVFLHKCYTNWFSSTYPQWTIIQKFNVSGRGRVNVYTKNFQEGGVEIGLFTDKFQDLEEHCWRHVRKIKELDWFKSWSTKVQGEEPTA